ncbi:MAG: glycosyltransferase [Anaerolineales bacterium]
MNTLWDFFLSTFRQQVGTFAYLLFILGNTLLNRLSLPRLGHHPPPADWPEVAVLIPARDEEANLPRCLRSLLAQDYPRFSVWVLDDESRDGTAEVVRTMANQDERLHLLSGQPLPDGWLGKPWACQQLAEAAPPTATLLLFVDADTWHAPDMLRVSVSALLAEKADLLSILPRQVLGSLAEWLSVPVLPWSLFSHFPLWLTRRVRWPSVTVAVGQHMLWRQTAYKALGGHAAVRRDVAEDIALARLSAAGGLCVLLLPGPNHVFCRMYRSAGDVLNGFGKNLFAIFNRRLLPYLFVWTWLGIAFIGPLVTLAGGLLFGWAASIPLSGAAVLVGFLIWILVAQATGLPAALALTYPFVILSAIYLAFHSLWQTLTSRSHWKGRRVL